MITNEQFFKLPRWAQNEINLLRNNIEHLEKKIAQYNGEQETNVFLCEGIDKKPLPKNSHIEFRTGKNSVHVYPRNDVSVDINTNSFDTTVILPRAANAFYISFVKI